MVHINLVEGDAHFSTEEVVMECNGGMQGLVGGGREQGLVREFTRDVPGELLGGRALVDEHGGLVDPGRRQGDRLVREAATHGQTPVQAASPCLVHQGCASECVDETRLLRV